jgi:hypothetical protein
MQILRYQLRENTGLHVAMKRFEFVEGKTKQNNTNKAERLFLTRGQVAALLG